MTSTTWCDMSLGLGRMLACKHCPRLLVLSICCSTRVLLCMQLQAETISAQCIMPSMHQHKKLNNTHVASRAVDIQVEILLVFAIQVQHCCHQLIACLLIYGLAQKYNTLPILHEQSVVRELVSVELAMRGSQSWMNSVPKTYQAVPYVHPLPAPFLWSPVWYPGYSNRHHSCYLAFEPSRRPVL